MATDKNITMKQFNGTDYDTLYPKTIASQIPDVYSKTDIITAETLSRLDLSADKLPNDGFQQIKTLIDNVQSSTDSKAKIQTGSYVGTGTYGANNPCSLTFDFEPKLFIISQKFKSSGTTNFSIWMIAYYGINYGLIGNGYSAHVNISSNAITYYDSDNAKNQYNDTLYEYNYIVIG